MKRHDTTCALCRSLVWSLVLVVCMVQGGYAQQTTQSFTAYAEPGMRVVPSPVGVVQQAPAVSKVMGLTFYTSRPIFEATFADLTVEDFEGSNVPPNAVVACLGPFNSATNNLCYSAGAIVNGVSLLALGNNQMVILTPNVLGVTSTVVGPNFFPDDLEISFTGPDDVFAAGFDLLAPFGPFTFTIEAFGSGGSLGSTTHTSGTNTGTFFGVFSDTDPITRILISSLVPGAFEGELIDNLTFGEGIFKTDLAVSKSADDPTPAFGQTITFTVEVTNNGPGLSDGIEVTDAVPFGLTFAGASTTQGTYNANSGVWNVGMLADGASATLTLAAVVETLNPVTNTATITDASTSDTDPTNNTASATLTPQAVDLSIDKTVDDDEAAIGALVTFTIVVRHNAGADLFSVRVRDLLPEGLAYNSSTVSQGLYDPATGNWQVGALGIGDMAMLTLAAVVESLEPITNTATIVFSNLPDPFPGDNTDTALVNAVAADLEMTKKVVAFSTEGAVATVMYEVEVSNEGPRATGGVEVADYLSGAMTLVGLTVSQGAASAGAAVIWDVGELGEGATATMTLTVEVPLGSSLLNTAEVTKADLPDPDSTPGDGEGDDFAVASASPRTVPDFVPEGGPGGSVERGNRFTADLELTKTVDVDTAPTNGDVHYTVTVENLGPQSTAKVEVADQLPGCLVDASWTSSRGDYDGGLWTVGKVKVGEKVTLEVWATVGPDCSGTVTNTAEITASSLPDPTDLFNLFDSPRPNNDQDEASFSVETGRRSTLDGQVFALGANYPNPFNPATVVPFSLAEASYVSIKVYDVLGRSVATLVEGERSRGVHAVRFDASHLPTGLYLVRMEAAGFVKTQRITLMR